MGQPPEFAIFQSPVYSGAAHQDRKIVTCHSLYDNDLEQRKKERLLVMRRAVVSINDDDGFGGHGAATVKQRPVGSAENFNRPAVPYSCRSDPPDPSPGFLVSQFLVLVFLNCVHHTLSTVFLPRGRSSPKTNCRKAKFHKLIF